MVLEQLLYLKMRQSWARMSLSFLNDLHKRSISKPLRLNVFRSFQANLQLYLEDFQYLMGRLSNNLDIFSLKDWYIISVTNTSFSNNIKRNYCRYRKKICYLVTKWYKKIWIQSLFQTLPDFKYRSLTLLIFKNFLRVSL